MSMPRSLGGALACALLGLVQWFQPAAAQEYPTKNATIIVPFVAGGGTDILGRMIGQRLEQKWGKPFTIENRPGAGGVVGAQAAARAAPDGYTIFLASVTNLAVNPTLYKKLPYNPETDFIPLALVAATPFVLVVNPKLPVKTVGEFIAYAKASPSPLNYATSGPGVPHHLFAELFKTMTGVQMTPVPYKGSLPALNDVVAGHVPLMFVDLGPALGPIQAGSARAIGVTTGKRIGVLPDVPPINDTLQGFDVSGWFMMTAPKGTPPKVVETLHNELKRMLAEPDVAQTITKAGMLPMETPSVPEMQRFVTTEIARWGDVVRKAGVEGSF